MAGNQPFEARTKVNSEGALLVVAKQQCLRSLDAQTVDQSPQCNKQANREKVPFEASNISDGPATLV